MPARDISERAVRLREGVRRDHCVCCVRAAGGQINLIFLAYEYGLCEEDPDMTAVA